MSKNETYYKTRGIIILGLMVFSTCSSNIFFFTKTCLSHFINNKMFNTIKYFNLNMETRLRCCRFCKSVNNFIRLFLIELNIRVYMKIIKHRFILFDNVFKFSVAKILRMEGIKKQFGVQLTIYRTYILIMHSFNRGN